MPDKYETISRIVREENLARVNEVSKGVTPKNTFYTRYGKRVLDVAIALPCVAVTAPINLALGIATYFDVGRPILFVQERTGKGGRRFGLAKFRNMTNDTDESGNLLPASERVTKFGAFVRKYSLDELLNFWYVLKGDMSIIGPRPLPSFFDDKYSDRHRMRLEARPGLECPTIGSHGKVRLYQEQFENDVWYVENVSLAVDVRMIWELFLMVVDRGERADHAKVGGGYFVGYDREGVAFSMRRIPEEYERRYEELVASSVGDGHE